MMAEGLLPRLPIPGGTTDDGGHPSLLGESPSGVVASAQARRRAGEYGIAVTALSGADETFIEPAMPGTVGGAAYRAQIEGGLKARAEKAQRRLTESFADDCTGDGIAPTALSFHRVRSRRCGRPSAGCDLVVAGHDVTFRGLRREPSSEILSELLRAAPRPVLIRPDQTPPEGDVPAAYDGSVPAVRALQLLVPIGSRSGRRVHASSVDPDRDLAGRRAGMAASHLRAHGYEVDEHPIASTAPPAEVIEVQAARRVRGACHRRLWPPRTEGVVLWLDHTVAHGDPEILRFPLPLTRATEAIARSLGSIV